MCGKSLFDSRGYIKKDIIIMVSVYFAPILILSLLLIPGMWTRQKESRIVGTRYILELLVTAIEKYKLDFGDYPPEDIPPVGCANLIKCLLTTEGGGPYIHIGSNHFRPDGQLKDGWGRPFTYRYQSVNYNIKKYTIYSCGPNGIDEHNLSGHGDDITNW